VVGFAGNGEWSGALPSAAVIKMAFGKTLQPSASMAKAKPKPL
jgi:hypothetical protein